jgi:uncharacterized membrane protein
MTGASGTARHREGLSLPDDRLPVALLVSGIVTALTLGTAFGLLALGVEQFWVVFPLGFGVVLPTALGVVTHARMSTKNRGTDAGESDSADPLEELRTQYARGEISEAEFERRVDRLIESDDF